MSVLLESNFIATQKWEKGLWMKQYCKENGVSKPTFYRRQREYLANNGVFNEKKAITRIPPERHSQILKECFILAATQKFYFDLGCEKAKELLTRDGKISEISKLSVSQINRWLRKFGMSKRLRKQTSAAIRWTADYPHQIVMCDASPVEQYYMNFKGHIIKRPDLEYKDKHTYDKLNREGLVRVWGYYMVDVFSGAYLVYYRAKPGESTDGWIASFSYFFAQKQNENIPVQGVPHELLYTDLGSGLHSARTKAFLSSLNPNLQVMAHPKKHPWSKGRVEARIGAWKKIEKIFHRDYFETIEDLNRMAEEWMVYDQALRTKKFQTWANATVEHPIKMVTAKNLEDAKVTRIKRKVDAYRCVVIENTQWRIPVDVPTGLVVDIFYRESKPYCQLPTGVIVELFDAGPFNYNDKEAFRIPERLKRLNELDKQYNDIGNSINPESIKPDLQGLTPPFTGVGGSPIQTHSTAPSDSYTLEEATSYVIEETGLDECEWVELFEKSLSELQKSEGKLTGQTVREFTNSIIGARQ